MRRFDSDVNPGRRQVWRQWIVVAWVIWCGTLYGKMVVEQRGAKLQAWIVQVTGARAQRNRGATATRAEGAGFSIVKRSTSWPSTSQAR
jgi:hypothetical protein